MQNKINKSLHERRTIMPIDKEKMQKVMDAIDDYFAQRAEDEYDDDDDDFLNPLDAPPSEPFYKDGAQHKPKRDLFS
jgi:hypothetical protein